MWQEQRKQEKKIKGFVDYRKRAERRQNFYEKIKADPTQFMQIHGRKCKIHLDPALEDLKVMMPWQGQVDTLIDRFDVRAHLDFIPVITKIALIDDELTTEDRQCNYESYRILAQNDFIGITEEKFLHQLYLEEQFGVSAQIEIDKPKKKIVGVAIGYTYEDSDITQSSIPFQQTIQNVQQQQVTNKNDDSDSDLDVDVAIDISKLDTTQAHELNATGRNYGMKSNDFYSYLTKDADEAETLRMAREEEQEKIMLSGRKSRRERRAQRDKRLPGRTLSPPSYAAKEEPDPLADEKNESESRSPSPVNQGKITYITSFGGEDELQPHSKISINFNKTSKSGGTVTSQLSDNTLGVTLSYADKVKQNLDKLKHMNSMIGHNNVRKSNSYHRKSLTHSRSRTRSRSRSRSGGRRRTRTRSSSIRDRDRRRRISRSRSNQRKTKRYSSTSSTTSSSSSSTTSSSKRLLRRKRKSLSPSSSSRSSSSASTRSDIKPKKKYSSDSTSTTPSPSPSSRLTTTSNVVIKKSNSPMANFEKMQTNVDISPPVKKYYGRKKEDVTSSEEDLINDDDNAMDTSISEKPSSSSVTSTSSLFGKTSSSSSEFKGGSRPQCNPRDRLKKKMQILLNKQFKADKKAEIERTERQVQLQQEREDEMRELALKLRRRQRELRHKYGTPTSSASPESGTGSSEENIRHKKRSRSPIKKRSPSRSKSRSRTRSRSRPDHIKNRDRSRDRYRNRRSKERITDRRRDHDRDREREIDRERDRERDRDRGRRDRSSSRQKPVRKLVDY